MEVKLGSKLPSQFGFEVGHNAEIIDKRGNRNAPMRNATFSWARSLFLCCLALLQRCVKLYVLSYSEYERFLGRLHWCVFDPTYFIAKKSFHLLLFPYFDCLIACILNLKTDNRTKNLGWSSYFSDKTIDSWVIKAMMTVHENLWQIMRIFVTVPLFLSSVFNSYTN